MRVIECAVCKKPIGKHERRYVQRRRVSLVRRLLTLVRNEQAPEIHIHPTCKR